MTYALQADMSAEFGDTELSQLCDRVNTPPVIPLDASAVTVLTAALTRADSEINTYVGQRYTLPFAATPERVRTAALDIARFYLYDSRAPKIVQDRFNSQIQWLKDLSAGKAVLVDAAAALIVPATGAQISVQAFDAVFTDGDDGLLALT